MFRSELELDEEVSTLSLELSVLTTHYVHPMSVFGYILKLFLNAQSILVHISILMCTLENTLNFMVLTEDFSVRLMDLHVNIPFVLYTFTSINNCKITTQDIL